MLDQVYAAAKAGRVEIDGQNVFVYHGNGSDTFDVEFGVGTTSRFETVDQVHYSETPSGPVATVTHWGDYRKLGEAHDAVIQWCRENGHALTETRWEVYGHMTNDPSAIRTDIFYQLR